MGRLSSAKSGIEARGGTATDRNQVPYKQDYAYNAFGNVTSRQTFHWTQTDNQTHSWVNNKESTWSYDADGRLKQTPKNRYYYDAKGAVVMTTLDNNRRMIQHLDGESKPVRQDQYGYNPSTYQYFLQQTEYFIYSSVLGKLLTEVTSGGTKKRTFVYGTGGVVALQQYGGTNQEVRWEHTDPSNATYIQTGYNGTMYYLQSPAELDPLGSSVGMTNPYNQPQPEQAQSPGWGYGSWGDPFGSYTCMVDWISQPCSMAAAHLAAGSGIIYNGPQFTQVRYNGQTTIAQYRAFGDGFGGFIPGNASYIGGGRITPIGGYTVGWGQIRTDLLNLARLNGLTTGLDRNRAVEGIVLGRLDWATYKSLQDSKTLHPVSPEEVGFIRSQLEELLNENKQCAELISEMSKLAGMAKGFMQRFGEFAANGIYRIKSETSGAAASIYGGITNTGFAIHNQGYYPSSPAATNGVLRDIIHEVFHVPASGKFLNHIGMATVANSAAKNLGLATPMKFPSEKDYKGEYADEFYKGAMTQFFGSSLKEYCSGRPRLRRRE